MMITCFYKLVIDIWLPRVSNLSHDSMQSKLVHVQMLSQHKRLFSKQPLSLQSCDRQVSKHDRVAVVAQK